MYAKIVLTGNSACVIVPKGVLNELELQRGDYIEIKQIRKLSELEIQEAKRRGYVR